MTGFSPIYEISSERTVAGRRPIKAALHEIFPDADSWQENGISWNEEYTRNNLESVVGMSIVAEFLTDERDIPYGHGMTDIRDNMPLFEDATVVGHFDRAYIGDIEIDGETKRALIADGTLDEMRYPKFVSWLREHMAESVVKGSVEIAGKPENDGRIIYSGGWKEQGRVPQVYDYSGYAILGVKPADEAAIVMELNNKQIVKEDDNMNEELKNELMAVFSESISEMNSKWDEYYARVQAKEAEITQLNADIQAKEAEIAQLRADLEKDQAEKAAMEAGLTEANAKIAEMENEKAKAELNAALTPYTEEQRAIAKDDIDAFNENPGSIEINSIVGKICTEIVRAAQEASKVSEINSAGIDVFSMIDDVDPDNGDSEVNVF